MESVKWDWRQTTDESETQERTHMEELELGLGLGLRLGLGLSIYERPGLYPQQLQKYGGGAQKPTSKGKWGWEKDGDGGGTSIIRSLQKHSSTKWSMLVPSQRSPQPHFPTMTNTA